MNIKARALLLAALLLTVMTMPHAGRAAESEAAATSSLVGIALPQGAERVLDVKTVEEYTAPLGTLAAGLDSPMRVQATEVLGWGGPGYRREDGRRVIAQVQAALQKAGLQMQQAGEPQSVQGNTLSFFVAGSARQRKALVGYWLEGEQLLVLVWGQFGAINAPGGANKAGGSVLDRVSSAPVGAAPRPDAAPSMPTFPRLSAGPNQATGAVLSMSGQPLPGARIRFWRLTPQGAVIEYTARTDARGIYAISLPPSDQYRIDNATALVTYGAYRYYLPLRPEGGDGSFFDGGAVDIARGYVRNFVLPISGYISNEEDPKQELSYYGGSVIFRAKTRIVIPNDPDPFITGAANGPNALPEGTRIHLTLTPQGPLLDGSAGRPLSWDLRVTNNTGKNAYTTTIKDVPLGVYTAQARVTTPDGNTYEQPLTARIVLVNDISRPFTTDPENPIFFAPRWEDWPMMNGNVDAHVFIKRSGKGGAGSVWLSIGD